MRSKLALPGRGMAGLKARGRGSGQYRLCEAIGEGAFGTVWRAEQERPLRWEVAIKILKPGMDTLQVTARFEQERQVLAMMDHPRHCGSPRRRQYAGMAGLTS